ncbi:MAG: ROK family protein [Candidatus Omnitrophica bacterium]|nr:ROK family protein [Candidatus Omnitrophota bacterium]
MQVFLGIDWGGTYIKAGLVDSRGKIVKKKVYSSGADKQGFIKKIKTLLRSFSGFNMKGIGIGAPGIIDIEKGFIYYLPNIPGWKNYPLRSVLEKHLQLPVFIDNDANVFALAEVRCGAAKGKKRAIFLTLGTGLGGAIIFNGKLLEGKTSALELGHVPINSRGKLCGCGGTGCIETYVGNRYLVSHYRRLKKKTRVIEVKEIFERGLKGEKEALAVFGEFSRNLGKFLAGMINVFNPQVIIFGGGVSGAFKLFKPLVEKEIKKQVMWPQYLGVSLVRAKLKDAGIIGAAFLAREKVAENKM